MLGATPLTSVLGSGVDNRDHAAVRSFINAACGQGLALLLIHPNSKAPADMRTSRTKSAQDRAAQNVAKEAGRPDWQKVRSPSGLALATTDAKIVNRYLDEYIRIHGDDVPVNLAVEVGKSRLVVVDCDTKAQYEKFIAVAQAPEGTSPTVTSPGQIGPNGDWAHKDGGHFYFTVPDGVELPKNLGAMTWGGEDGFAVLWDRRYVLIPPSSRPEGKYELTGRDYPLPGWLRDEILKVGEVRELRAAKMSTADDESDLTNSIDAWSETISWADILEPLGWSPSPRADACGCAVWTAPGNHASPKSATAHDSGCNLGIYTQTNAPLHIWTDHPGEPFEAYIDRTHSQTLSKLQAVAYAEFDGNVGAAMDSLDLIPPPDTIASELGVDTRDMVNGVASEDVAAEIVVPEPVDVTPLAEVVSESTELPDPEPQPSEPADDTFADGDDRDPDVWESNVNGVPTIAPFSHWLSLPPPEFVVDGLVEHGALVSVIGPPGAGKALSLDTPLPTPTGWTTMGEVQVGDLLLGRDGLPTAVRAATEVMYGRPCFEVEFSDGSVLVADAQHQWRTSTRHQRSPKSKSLQGERVVDSIRTTEELLATLTVEEGRLNHSVAPTLAVILPEADLPIAPYTLGAWLGDGTSAGNGFTSADPELVDRIRDDGYEVKHHDVYRYSILTRHELDTPQPRDETFTALLRKAGVLGNKHIPTQYLRASERQRRDLLAGLLDTDGWASNGSAEFTTTRQRLMEDTYELIVSLGYRCSVRSKIVKGRTPESSVAWNLTFPANEQVFQLPRKVAKMAAAREGRSGSRTGIRYITAIRPIESVPVRCVEVNNDEHMYLAGRSMIPTHNSTLALDMACHIATGMRWQGRDTLKTRVLYMPGEGLSGVVQRLRAWSALHKIDIATDLMLANNIIQLGASREAWGELAGYIIRNEIGLVIFDTFARMAVGLEENSATEVGKAVVRFDQIRRLTNAGVMIVHHTVKGNDQMSRGSSALNGALESEIAVLAGWSAENIGAGDPPEGKELTVITTKQKNAEQLEDGIPLLMRNYSRMDAAAGIDAPVITGPGGSVDPLEGDVVLARPIPEPIIETAIRIREFVDRFTEQGCTRSDIVTGVEPDPYTKTLKESAKRWRIKVNEAVDRGLWAGLLMTLEGASSRYVSGTQTAEGARAMVTAAVITD